MITVSAQSRLTLDGFEAILIQYLKTNIAGYCLKKQDRDEISSILFILFIYFLGWIMKYQLL